MTTKNVATATVMLFKDPQPQGFWRDVWRSLRSNKSDGGVNIQVRLCADDGAVMELPTVPIRMWPGDMLQINCGAGHTDDGVAWQEVH